MRSNASNFPKPIPPKMVIDRIDYLIVALKLCRQLAGFSEKSEKFDELGHFSSSRQVDCNASQHSEIILRKQQEKFKMISYVRHGWADGLWLTFKFFLIVEMWKHVIVI